jgi:beta-aspartyl-peptidase (threonine type)
LEQWRARREAWLAAAPDWIRQEYSGGGDTVGAVVLDSAGVLAAATSTGGTLFKLPGRVGDSPIPGAGNYADEFGAASGTGTGERLMRTVLAFRVVQAMGRGVSVAQALAESFERLGAILGAEAGMIAMDATGNVGVRHTTEAMPHGYVSALTPAPVVRMRAP